MKSLETLLNPEALKNVEAQINYSGRLNLHLWKYEYGGGQYYVHYNFPYPENAEEFKQARLLLDALCDNLQNIVGSEYKVEKPINYNINYSIRIVKL